MNFTNDEDEGHIGNNREASEATNIMYMTHGHVDAQHSREESTYYNTMSTAGIAVGDLKNYVERKRDALSKEYKVRRSAQITCVYNQVLRSTFVDSLHLRK